MADRLTAGRKDAGKAADRVEALCHSLWVTEGRATFAASAGNDAAAEAFAAELGRVLVDRLQPAVEDLRRLAEARTSEKQPAGAGPVPRPGSPTFASERETVVVR